MKIIGVDFASKPGDTGLARATVSRNGATWRAALECVMKASNSQRPAMIVKDWLRGQEAALIAIDAPLGWPDSMRMALPWHTAGRRIWTDDERFFRRETDRRISDDPGKDPLEVGANLIARTAYWALQFLDDLRRQTGRGIPLAWDRESVLPISVIEVYPAATLKAHKLLPRESYKKNKTEHRKLARGARVKIVSGLEQQVEDRAWKLEIIEEQRKRLLDNDDMLDAAVCVLAALDFLRGAARPPEDRDEAKREGWIWCKGIAQ